MKKQPPQANPQDLMRRMMRDHLDLLQNIEFVLVQAARSDKTVDDAVVAQALRGLIKDEVPEDDRAVSVVEALIEMEELRPDIGERLWRDSCRMVLESVHTHSTLQPGNRGYLDFVSAYVA